MKRLSLIFALPLVLMLAAQAHGQITQGSGGSSGGGGPPTGAAGGSLTGTYPNPGLAAPYGATTYTAHGFIVGEGASNLAATAACAIGSFPFGQGSSADPVCSTLILPNAATQGDLLTATAANTVGSVADVATGSVLTSGGVGAVPVWSATPTLANINAIFNAGTIGSGGTLTCNMSGAAICLAIIGAGGITLAAPTNVVANQVYWLLIKPTANVAITPATTWKGVQQGGNGALLTLTAFNSGVSGSQFLAPFVYDGTTNSFLNETSLPFFSTQHLDINNMQFQNDSTAMSSMGRYTMRFDEGPDTALTTNESLGTFKTTKAITIENIVEDIKISPTCSVSEVITCYDCGATAGACTSSQTATISTTTTATGATRQSVDQTVSTANVAAAHYISCLITAGTCTVSDNSIGMIARPQ